MLRKGFERHTFNIERKTAGDLNESIFNDRATITAIKGNSVAWNQMMPNYAIGSMDNSYISYANNNGIITINIKQTTMNQQYDAPTPYYINLIKGHKYLYLLNESCPITTYIIYYNNATFNPNTIHTQPENEPNAILRLRAFTGTNYTVGAYTIIPMLFDLTVMYGKGAEPTSVNQFRNDYFKWFGHQISNERYDSGSFRNVKIDSLKINSFNLFNNWANQFVDSTNGGFENNSSSIRSDYIKMLPGVQYYAELNVGELRMRFYDNNKRYLGFNGQVQSRTANFSMRYNNGTYVVLTQYPNSDGTAADPTKFTFNISDTSNGIIEEHEDRTYSIPITSITGKLNGTGNSEVIFPDGMKSVGNIRDEISVNNGVTKAIKKVGVIDNAGNLSWSGPYSFSGNNAFYYHITDGKNNNTGELRLDKYYANYAGNANVVSVSSLPNKEYSFKSNQNWIYLKDDSCANTTALKSALQGIKIYYELQTPLEYTIDNFNLPINTKVYKKGTEEFLPENNNSSAPQFVINYNV